MIYGRFSQAQCQKVSAARQLQHDKLGEFGCTDDDTNDLDDDLWCAFHETIEGPDARGKLKGSKH
eukprot:8750253-Pyramimonas_sp.AAC.1